MSPMTSVAPGRSFATYAAARSIASANLCVAKCRPLSRRNRKPGPSRGSSSPSTSTPRWVMPIEPSNAGHSGDGARAHPQRPAARATAIQRMHISLPQRAAGSEIGGRAYHRRMRRAALVFALVAMVASCKLRSLANLVAFEGEIEMSVGSSMPSMGSIKSSIKMEMKGDKARTELGGFGGGYSITDASQKKVWTVIPASHSYTELDLSKAAAVAKPVHKPKTTARKTGRSDKVAGYDCDVYEVDDPSGALSHTQLCLASGLS